jgi:hypothetical protein
VEGLKAILNRCVGGEVERHQAIEEARQIIAEYVQAERGRAQSYVRAKTGNMRITVTPEMERQYMGMVETYLGDFTGMLDDALKGGVAIE